MGGKFELFRVRGLPVLIDISFIILIVLWGQHYFTSGNTRLMSAGFVIVLGLAASILLHEFAHAVIGQRFNVRPEYVELNGLGGACYWASPMRSEAWPRIAISLAGPASNLFLWFLFDQLGELQTVQSNRMVSHVVTTLETANWWLFVFNMMPAYPLDGGKALDALLGKIISNTNAARVVASLGLCLAAYCAYLAVNGNMWMLVLAALLGLTNWAALQNANNPPWQRWN